MPNFGTAASLEQDFRDAARVKDQFDAFLNIHRIASDLARRIAEIDFMAERKHSVEALMQHGNLLCGFHLSRSPFTQDSAILPEYRQYFLIAFTAAYHEMLYVLARERDGRSINAKVMPYYTD